MKQKIILLALSAMLIAAPVTAEARGLVPCGGYRADGSREPVCTVVDMFYLVARVTNWLIMISALYAVYAIVGNSFYLIVSQGNEEVISKRKAGLTNAVVGFILVLMAFLMVNTVVNLLLKSKCTIDLRDPLTYLSVNPNYNNCQEK